MISNEAQKNVEEIYHIALLGAIETNKTSGEFVRNSKKPKPPKLSRYANGKRNVISNQKSFNQFQFPQVIDI